MLSDVFMMIGGIIVFIIAQIGLVIVAVGCYLLAMFTKDRPYAFGKYMYIFFYSAFTVAVVLLIYLYLVIDIIK